MRKCLVEQTRPLCGNGENFAAVCGFRRVVALLLCLAAGTVAAGEMPSGDAVAPTAGLVVHYTFDQIDSSTVPDQSGKGAAGTLIDGPQPAEGVSGSALSFSGTGRVEVPVTALTGLQNQLTVAFWTRGDPRRLPRRTAAFWADGAAGGELRGQVPSAGGLIQWVAGKQGRVTDVLRARAARAQYEGQWNHWVLVKNTETTEMAIYLNGQAWRKAVERALPVGTFNAMAIGSTPGGKYPFRGLIDDFRIYDRALEPEEINALFRATGQSLLSRCGGMWLNNGCFEDGSIGGWHARAASYSAAKVYQGSGAAQLGSGTSRRGEIRQTVFGLNPATDYRLRGWVASSNEADMALAAEGYGASTESPWVAAGSDWKEIVLDFRTGSRRTSATVSCIAKPHVRDPRSKGEDNGYDTSYGYCDNLTLETVSSGDSAFPTANDDTATLRSGDTVDINVLANDSDGGAGELGIRSYTQPRSGTVERVGEGDAAKLRYTAATGFTGGDGFSYTVSNGRGGVDAALVKVTVPAGIPSELSASGVTDTSVSLSWRGSSARPAASYEILRNGQVVGSSPSELFTDSGLAPGENYGYSVMAVDASGNRSDPSARKVVTTTGEPLLTSPSVGHGDALWATHGCASCHVPAKDFTKGADPARLTAAIVNNRGGMGQFSFLSAQDVSDLAAYVVDAQNGGGSSEPSKIQGVSRLSNEQTLRRAALLFAARLPTETELLQAAQGDSGLRQALRGLMEGSRFTEFVYETGNRQFLTAGAGTLSKADFPALDTLSQTDATEYGKALSDARREPLELLRYIVENDRPYSEILTADYTLVNPRLAGVYQAQLLQPFPTGAADEWVPARIPAVSARTSVLAATPYPHAGVLSSHAWLSRFPTTATNRNRHRSKMVYRQFLAFDIESQGQRPVDDSQNGHYLVPTMENPNCLLCHRNMEPLAGAFQNWGIANQYLQTRGVDSLSPDYKSNAYYRNAEGLPWFRPGDRWYRDMIEPGFEQIAMPGSWGGFGRGRLEDRTQPRAAWTIAAVSSQANNSSLAGAKALDGDVATGWRSSGELPQFLAVDLGAAVRIGGVVYVPRSNGSLHIGAFDVQLSDDGQNWSTAATGTYSSANRDAKFIAIEPAVTARFLRLYVRTDAAGTTTPVQVNELYALKAPDEVAIPYATNANGTGDALQWAAREMVSDPRFAKGAVLFWYPGVYGRPPLAGPTNPADPGYEGRLAAFQVQDRAFEAMASAFLDSGLKVKDLLVELVMSDLFRAHEATGTLGESQRLELAEVGQGRLLDVGAINAKAQATIGRPLFDRATSGLGLLYNGFDGGRDVIKGNTDLTSTMLSAVEARIYTQICDNQVAKTDLALPSDQRALFPYVQGIESPAPFTGDGASVHIEQSIWNNLTGSNIASLETSLRYAQAADSVTSAESLESAVNRGDNYGERYRGYLVPPADGSYTFWAAGDDWVSLRLAATPDAADLREIAAVAGYTLPQQWDKYPGQQSVAITLSGGKRYLLELLHKEGGGGDHVSAAWSGPGFDRRPLAAADFAELATVPAAVRQANQTVIKRNLQHLHARLLGESLALTDPEIERSFRLYQEVFNNTEAETSGLTVQCEARAGAAPGQRAWNAVLVYLMTDFRYLGQ